MMPFQRHQGCDLDFDLYAKLAFFDFVDAGYIVFHKYKLFLYSKAAINESLITVNNFERQKVLP